ncbi:hypothetical protein OIDMADRAFT_174212 [Oidiodendron maius Zn]|uniref:Uncharacterized protein n=1 Tax=Oidiodendron maius (strain Zn) TaxID=913774 RepID=A0A0C3DYR0_OIDMZ|nr:hypothetical protein OIDMADRAFT_174212 [Oidiodendron maius Zn]
MKRTFHARKKCKRDVSNEQISMFLRILEYFEGTMILITHRVQTIDAAFKSRIHLSLRNPPLYAKSSSRHWETFILKSTKQRCFRWLDAKFLKKESAADINGREIKNIVRVAHALAINDKQSINTRDFSKASNKRKIVEGIKSSMSTRIRP